MKIYNLNKKGNVYDFFLQTEKMFISCCVSTTTTDVVLIKYSFNYFKENNEVKEMQLFEVLFSQEFIHSVINCDLNSLYLNSASVQKEFNLFREEIKKLINEN